MGTGRALLASARCRNCRLSLLNAFAASVELPLRPPLRSTYNRASTGIRPSKRQTYSSLHRSLDSEQHIQQNAFRTQVEEVETGKAADGNEENGEEDNTELYDGLDDSTSKPWYLQVETPTRDSNSLLQRQQLPELPPDPPPLLEPMLKHISVDLGIDDLTLFDLRDLDPPPALGANLLMVLGTARSEKHLHVSADRFCRWLKTTYKLSPYADGLLGRGELKLKLRRKARRAKLLSSVGSSEQGNVDDGIRTGWICVNVGTIEDGRKTSMKVAEQEDYVGFGDEGGGAKVVIQMLMEDKREELDLEDLWGKTLKRHKRKEARISEGPDQIGMEQYPSQHDALTH